MVVQGNEHIAFGIVGSQAAARDVVGGDAKSAQPALDAVLRHGLQRGALALRQAKTHHVLT
ncbi:conserved hypothetical protein, partial [Ricinus communis]